MYIDVSKSSARAPVKCKLQNYRKIIVICLLRNNITLLLVLSMTLCWTILSSQLLPP